MTNYEPRHLSVLFQALTILEYVVFKIPFFCCLVISYGQDSLPVFFYFGVRRKSIPVEALIGRMSRGVSLRPSKPCPCLS